MKHWNNQPTDDPPAPTWASFFTGTEYRRFLEVVTADLTRRGLPHSIDDGIVRLETDSANQLGLQNLAQKCHSAGGTFLWPSVVRGHFDSIVTSRSEVGALDEKLEDFESVRPHLKVRLYRAESLSGVLPAGKTIETQFTTWAVGDDLLAVLVLDLPTSVVTVADDQRSKWSVPDEALLTAAIENVATQDPVSSTDLPLPAGSPATAYYGDNFFVASHLLPLAALRDVPPEGLLVAVPHRHCLLVYDLLGPEAIVAVNALLPKIQGLYREGPGSISDQIYLFRGEGAGPLAERFVRIPSRVQGQELVVEPPPLFVEALERLTK